MTGRSGNCIGSLFVCDIAAAAQWVVAFGRFLYRVVLRGGRVGLITVAAELKDIARHVVETQLVGTLGAYGLVAVVGIGAIPCHVVYLVAAAVAVAAALASATGCILPFGLGGQPVVLAGEGVELLDKRLDVVPRDIFDGVVAAELLLRRVAPHHLLPERLGGLVAADVEAAHGHLMGGLGILGIPVVFGGSGTHDEGAALDIDHVGSQLLQRVGHRCRSLRLRTGLRLGGGLGGSGCLGAYDALRSGFGGQGCEHDGDE